MNHSFEPASPIAREWVEACGERARAGRTDAEREATVYPGPVPPGTAGAP
jgi:hypothetical protein